MKTVSSLEETPATPIAYVYFKTSINGKKSITEENEADITQPKAGQGMNYGLLDAHNLAWKLHLVESGLMKPELLSTYEQERRQAAERLIEFDATYAGLFSSHDPSNQANDEFVRIFKQNSLLLSGYGVEYPTNALTVTSSNDLFLSSLHGLRPGRNLPPANVTRVIDACEVPLERDIPFNGSFRVYIFAGDQQPTGKALMDLAGQLTRGDSALSRFLGCQPNLSYDKRHNPHSELFTFSIVFNSKRAGIELASLPELFVPYRYHVYSDESRSRKSHTEGHGMAHAKMGFDSREGGAIVVRPDGYVGCIVKLVEGKKVAEALDQYFSGFVSRIPIIEPIQSML